MIWKFLAIAIGIIGVVYLMGIYSFFENRGNKNEK